MTKISLRGRVILHNGNRQSLSRSSNGTVDSADDPGPVGHGSGHTDKKLYPRSEI